MRVSKTAKLQKNGILIGLFEVENRKDSKTTKLQKNHIPVKIIFLVSNVCGSQENYKTTEKFSYYRTFLRLKS